MQLENALFIVRNTVERANATVESGKPIKDAFPEIAGEGVYTATNLFISATLEQLAGVMPAEQVRENELAIASAIVVAMVAGYGYGMADSAAVLSETSDPDTWNLEGE